MDSGILTITWLAIGVLLIVAELLIPGLIIVFFGVSALILSFLVWTGLITSVLPSVILWIVLSLLMVLVFRRLALKLFPSDRSYQLVEDDVNAIGAVVEVTKTIDDNSTDGRIQFSGTSWPAVSNNGIIEAGKKARILYRDNISWIVEAFDENE